MILAGGTLKGPTDLMSSVGRKTGDSPLKKVGNINDDLFSPSDAPSPNNFTFDDPESRHLK